MLNPRYSDHAPNHVSEKKALAQIAELLKLLGQGDIDAFAETYPLPVSSSIFVTEDDVTEIANRLKELEEGYQAVKHVAAAALALEGEVNRTRRELEKAQAEHEQAAATGGVDRQAFKKSLRSIVKKSGWLEKPKDPDKLRNRLRAVFPAIWFIHGKLVLPPQEQANNGN